MPPEALRCQEIKCKSVLGAFGILETQFWTSYSFDPYINCDFNCVYCHVRAKKYAVSEKLSDPIYVKTNAPQVLTKELSSFKRKGVVRLSLGTDPYQPLEKKYQITRRILEILKENGWPFAISTKSDLILRDLEIISQASKKSWCCIAVSIATLDESLAKVLEPNAPPPKRRLEVVRRLSDEGITVGVWLIPLIPYITDSEQNMSQVIKAAVDNGAQFVLTGMLDMRWGSNYFKNFLKDHYKHLVPRYESLYAGKPTCPSWGDPDESYLDAKYLRFISLCRKYKVENYLPYFYSSKQALLFYLRNSSRFSGQPFELPKTLNFLFPSKEILRAIQIRCAEQQVGKGILKALSWLIWE
jgi:DNA repair photolyase